MIIGVDFDNTIACYDALMCALAREWGLIGPDVIARKKNVRDAIRRRPDGETDWRRLQVTAYGPRLRDAVPMPGVMAFFAACRQRGVPTWVVSHKTEWSNFGEPRFHLRDAALAWLDQQGFFGPATGLDRARVWFESTREEKIVRIRALGVTHFVDDLEETFREPTFPPGVKKMLLDADAAQGRGAGIATFADWDGVRRYLHLDFQRENHDGCEGVVAETDTARSAVATQDDGRAGIRSAVAAPLYGASASRIVSATPLPMDDAFAEIKAHCARLMGASPTCVARIGRGRNSRVYRVVGSDGRVYVAKRYCQRTQDGLSRLEVEYACLTFLWEEGVRCVPRPLAADPEAQLACFDYIEGEAFADPGAVAESDIDRLTEFLGQLKRLTARPEAARFAPASEACFSLAAVADTMRARRRRLGEAAAAHAAPEGLGAFLTQRFDPALERLTAWAERQVGAEAYQRERPAAARTLSPSDYGFHNALRRPSGDLVFLDFEYFGWDDPAKMIVDFLWHPALELPSERKRRFWRALRAQWADVSDLPRRVEVAYPLFGLKWCLILLNEFVPEHWARRAFAERTPEENETARRRQLAKAETMLTHVLDQYERFPYAG